MSEIDKNDKDLVAEIVSQVMKKQAEETTKALGSNTVDLQSEISKIDFKSVMERSVVGVVSKKSLSELDMTDRSDAPDAGWKLVTLDLIGALGKKDYNWLSTYRTKVLPNVEGTDALGGFTVPTRFREEVLRQATEVEVIAPRATTLQITNTDSLNLTSQAGRPRWYQTAESALKSSTSVEFGQTTLTVYKHAAVAVFSDELLSDSFINMIDYVTGLFASSLAEYRDGLFVNGGGTTTVNGIDSYTFVTIDAAGALTLDHLNSAVWRLPTQYRNNAVFLMHSQTAALVQQLKRNNEANNYALAPDPQSAVGFRIWGKEVVVCDAVSQDRIFLIDLSTYYVGERQGMTLDLSNEATMESSSGRSMFQRDETMLRVVTRFGGCMPITAGCVEINDIRS